MAEVDKVKTKIFHLLNKTLANGCTEAEALAAARKAGQLMDQYGLNMSDIEIKTEGCVQGEIIIGKKNGTAGVKRGVLDTCVGGLAAYCGVKVWFSHGGGKPSAYRFFGLKHDVEIFEYLYAVLESAMRFELETFKKTEYYRQKSEAHRGNGKTMVVSFSKGFCSRIYTKLMAMKDERNGNMARDAEKTGRNLVVVKDAIVTEEFAKLNLNLGNAKRAVGAKDWRAAQAGRDAAEKVSFNKGVRDGGNNGIKQLA